MVNSSFVPRPRPQRQLLFPILLAWVLSFQQTALYACASSSGEILLNSCSSFKCFHMRYLMQASTRGSVRLTLDHVTGFGSECPSYPSAWGPSHHVTEERGKGSQEEWEGKEGAGDIPSPSLLILQARAFTVALTYNELLEKQLQFWFTTTPPPKKKGKEKKDKGKKKVHFFEFIQLLEFLFFFLSKLLALISRDIFRPLPKS